MAFALAHPGFRSCEDCERWIYDPETGALKDYPAGSGVPVPRPAGFGTPCTSCQKVRRCEGKTPAEGRKMELSSKNRKTLELYQAIHGARLDGSGLDDLAVSNLGIIHGLITDYQRASK